MESIAPKPGAGARLLAGFGRAPRARAALEARTRWKIRRDIRALLDLAGATELAQLRIHHVAGSSHNCIPAARGKSLRAHAFGVARFFRFLAAITVSARTLRGAAGAEVAKALPHALSPDENRATARDRWQRPPGSSRQGHVRTVLLFGVCACRTGRTRTWRHRFHRRNRARDRKGNKTRVVPVGSQGHSPHWRTGSTAQHARQTGEAALFVTGAARAWACAHPAPAQFPRAQAGHRKPRASARAAPLVASHVLQSTGTCAQCGNARTRQHLDHAGLYPSGFSAFRQGHTTQRQPRGRRGRKREKREGATNSQAGERKRAGCNGLSQLK